MDFSWLSDPTALVALATLVVMEVVLGIDNLIFISILTNKLPEHQRSKARRIGIGLALILRLGLLGTIAIIVTADGADLHGLRPRLLLARPDPHRRRPVPGLEGDEGDPPQCRPEFRPTISSTPRRRRMAFGAAIAQILLLDLVFSLDSIITAVGMTDIVMIMVIAVVAAVTVMLLAADPLATFINNNPTVVMLALGFLLMIGMTLIAEGFGAHVPKGYIYAAMAFSALIEGLNMLSRRASRRKPADTTAPKP